MSGYLKLPRPGEGIYALGKREVLIVVASNYSGEEDNEAICLCILNDGPPFFKVVEISLETRTIISDLGAVYNIGTAVWQYHQQGGTVNNLGLDGEEILTYDEMTEEIANNRA